MGVTVREATEADGEDLLPLWRGFAAHLSAFNARYAPKEGAEDRWLSYFENQLLDSKDSVVLLAEDGDGEYVGVLEARIVGEHPIFQLGRHGQIDGLYVREDVRNRGVGRALLGAAEAWFGEDPRGVEFYRIETVGGDGESAAALRGLDVEPVSHTFEGDA